MKLTAVSDSSSTSFRFTSCFWFWFVGLRKWRGFGGDGDWYFTMVYFLCEGGDFESALEIAKECIGKGWVPNFTTMKKLKLVNGLVGVSKVDDAKKIIKEIKEKFAENSEQWSEIEEGLPQE